MDYREIWNCEGFRFKKALGQNFLTDENLLNAIAADAGVDGADTVVEVGPGAGGLTRALSRRAGRVIAYELDTSLAPVLEKTLSDCDNTEVVYKDILKESPDDLKARAGGRFKVVANLPYYLTTPVLFYFLENFSGELISLTVMVQKEVAERMTATAKKGDYGALSAAVAVRSEAKITRQVGRQCFTPPPNVDSAVVRLDLKEVAADVDLRKVSRVIRAGFAMKRKTLVNNLIAGFALKRDAAEGILRAAGIDLAARAETVPPEGFITLSKLLG